ncbi:hypothetical protein BGX34_007329 [Mortierella sp. NVP85]|nr:hypothetical protein BGX34_007329 [Mortierella sp. NVP85]
MSACNATQSRCDWDIRNEITLKADRWYPTVEALADDRNLFIFANTKAIHFSTETWSVIRNYPDLPGPPRNYPLSGGSLLLPLRPESNYEPEVLVCGGSTEFSSRAKGQERCRRIKPLTQNPEWIMEDMPLGRMMPDMVIFNGANKGAAGRD